MTLSTPHLGSCDASSASSAPVATDTAMDVDVEDTESVEYVSDEDASNSGSDDEEQVSLQDSLTLGLCGLDFEWTRAIVHTFPFAPNPCLTIKELGLIRLPLGDDDAKHIISASRKGRGRKSVGSGTQSTWEVASGAVSFENPAWPTFIGETLLEVVQDGLGLRKGLQNFTFQLHSLRLCKNDSQLLDQATLTADGVLVEAMVLLPSLHAAGQVQVSHATGSTLLSLPPDSIFNATVLAWYPDVTTTFEPTQSGYRLALYYRLVSTTPNSPSLNLPTPHEKLRLIRQTLEDWRDEKYVDPDTQVPWLEPHAFILHRRYSAVELCRGTLGLKGKDANTIANLVPIAKEVGFTILLASLRYTIRAPTQQTNQTGHGTDPKASSDPLDLDDPEEFTIFNIVDLNGRLVVGNRSTCLDEDQVVPVGAFRGVDPDGTASGGHHRWYDRTVIVLLPDSKTRHFLSSIAGLNYTVSELKKLDPDAVTQDDIQLAQKAVKLLKRHTAAFVEMFEIALSWKNFELWTNIFERAKSLEFPTPLYLDALNMFGFETFKPILEQVVGKLPFMAERVEFIDHILEDAESKNAAISSWCTTLRLSSLEDIHALEDEIPYIIRIAHANGIQETMSRLLPILQSLRASPDFWINLLRAMQDHIDNTLPNVSDGWQDFISQHLENTVTRWAAESSDDKLQPSSYNSYTYADLRIQPALELLSLIISFGSVNLSSTVLGVINSPRGGLVEGILHFSSPLVLKIQQILAKRNLSFAVEPFTSFARRIIGMYLEYILGSREEGSRLTFGGVHCSCMDCSKLDAFMKSREMTFEVSGNGKRRSHVEQHTDSELVTCKTKRQDIYTLVVTKKDIFIHALHWPTRQKWAREFLKTFGEEDVVARVLGSRATDVAEALDGTRPFQYGEYDIFRSKKNVPAWTDTPTTTSSSESLQGPSTPENARPASANLSTTILAGTKRKQPE